MKRAMLILALLLIQSFAFATEEVYLEDYGQCYITAENQQEWDEENAKIEAMLEYPELEQIFELMDESMEEDND